MDHDRLSVAQEAHDPLDQRRVIFGLGFPRGVDVFDGEADHLDGRLLRAFDEARNAVPLELLRLERCDEDVRLVVPL